MNTAIIMLYIPGDVKGQRRCNVRFTVNPIGSESAYSMTRITDLGRGVDYPVGEVSAWNSSKDVCRAIDIATHSEYAKKELGIDLTKLRGPRKGPPPEPDKNQTTFRFK